MILTSVVSTLTILAGVVDRDFNGQAVPTGKVLKYLSGVVGRDFDG